MLEKKKFYRIGSNESNQGLWYDKEGNFTGLIHTKYTFCACTALEMPFDEDLVGYISVADSLEHLYQWFPIDDIRKLQDEGYTIEVYSSDDYKFYEPFKHNVISQKNSELIAQITVE